jgi:xanthine/CO dehydrogenase XdhC/CoxF family maturation factor
MKSSPTHIGVLVGAKSAEVVAVVVVGDIVDVETSRALTVRLKVERLQSVVRKVHLLQLLQDDVTTIA